MAKEAPKAKKSGDKKAGKMSVKDRKDAGPVGFAKIQKYNKMRLPDGTHKRKIDKIKETLIQKAKVKKQYAKLLAKEKAKEQEKEVPEHLAVTSTTAQNEESTEGQAEMHPDRQTRIDEMDVGAEKPKQSEKKEAPRRSERKKPQKKVGYAKEREEAEKRRKEMEEKQKERAEREKQKRISIQQRNRNKKLMTAKTADGRKMLGKQSSVLLQKIQQQMST